MESASARSGFYRSFSLAAGGLILVACCVWPAGGVAYRCRLATSSIRPESGHAYVVRLPLLALLFSPSDSTSSHTRSETSVLEDGKPLGPAHALHVWIREHGEGAYSAWWFKVYFSTSDNSDPRANGRSYSLGTVLRLGVGAYGVGLGLVAIGLLLHRRPVASAAAWLRGESAAGRQRAGPGRVLLGLAVAIVVLPALFWADGEVWIRLQHPEIFNEGIYPYNWTPQTGFLYRPHAMLQDTNHLDYWVRQRTNAYGYLDRDWTETKAPGTLRVEFLGNSYVAATQVPLAEKVQARFERMAAEALSPLRVETAAFAYGGAGQSNQIQFYDTAGRLFHPDVVVLVFNYTDFDFNSALLECLRYGWSPDHLPALFYVPRGPAGTFRPAPIDPDFGHHELEAPASPPSSGFRAGAAGRWLMQKSCFATWLVATGRIPLPAFVRDAMQVPSQADPTPARMAAIERLPGYGRAFEGWHYPHDWDAESMFATEHLPAVFHDGVGATGAALDAFLERGRRDGFRLILLATELVSRNVSDDAIERETGNHALDRGYLVRLRSLAEPRGIPIVDLADYEARHGIDFAAVHWDHDLHWNRYGHEVAARALLEAFAAHPEWRGPGPRSGNK